MQACMSFSGNVISYTGILSTAHIHLKRRGKIADRDALQFCTVRDSARSKSDASWASINPLVVTGENHILLTAQLMP